MSSDSDLFFHQRKILRNRALHPLAGTVVIELRITQQVRIAVCQSQDEGGNNGRKSI
jgi:hypothetical protein